MTTTPPATGPLQVERRTFTAGDGEVLNYKTWLPPGPVRRSLVLLHRGHEHADRWDPVVPGLAMPETAIFAWEARGHGQSPGKRGHAPGFMTYVRDLECFMRHLAQAHGVRPEDTAVVAHSVGAVIAAVWVHDYGPRLAGLVLAAPAFAVKLYVPGALLGCRLMAKWNPDAAIKSYVRGHWLTRDRDEARRYNEDTTISRDISARILVDLFDHSRRIIDDAGVMDTPLLLLSAGDDSVVQNEAQERFHQRYGGAIRRRILLPGARHAVFHDLCRDEVASAIRTFVGRQFDGASTAPSGGPPEESAATQLEYAALTQPPPVLSLRACWFRLQRASMGTIGRLSEGIRLGWRTGFDSGESLDYVYENKARGVTPLGRMIDRGYLDAVGWRGIRQRRGMLREAIRTVLKQAGKDGLPPRLVDIAGGGGRYLLDMLSDPEPGKDLEILCRDWSESALDVGRTSARSLGLENRIRFERGDAFDEASLAAITPPPSVAVVSGLYELFPGNDRLRRSLRGLARALPPEGRLVYTNQPWHPQVEMIARVLINRDHAPWIMRRRPQAEMDALVREAGFEKTAQWTDDFGIFTVATARRSRD